MSASPQEIAAPTPMRRARSASQPGWEACLELTLGPVHGRTTIVRRRHRGPLLVQRPHHPEGETCHVHVLHPPGGVAGGDRLSVSVQTLPGARGLVTTPAAGKFYRSKGPDAVQRQRMEVAESAALEWLPQENILFAGARVVLDTAVHLRTGSRMLGWELVGLGRPAAGERFAGGALAQNLQVHVDDELLLGERTVLDGDGPAAAARWGFGGRGAFATLIAYPAGQAAEQAGQRWADEDPQSRAITSVDGLLIARYAGSGLAPARTAFEGLWHALRPAILGLAPSAPRIWAT